MATQFEINRKAAVDYVESQGWEYKVIFDQPGLTILEALLNVRSVLNSIRLFVLVSPTDIQSIGVAPLNADEDVRMSVSEYLTRANYGLKVGKFEFDFSDGEVRFQSILSCVNSKASHEDVKRIVDCPVAMFSRYGNGLLKCMYGFSDPKSAVEEAEAES